MSSSFRTSQPWRRRSRGRLPDSRYDLSLLLLIGLEMGGDMNYLYGAHAPSHANLHVFGGDNGE